MDGRRRGTSRTLRLIDAENVAGTGRLSAEDVAAAQLRLERVAPRSTGDHEVVAVSSSGNAVTAFFCWRGSAQFLLRDGRDGADLALVAQLADIDFICARYDRVVIASGDHLFSSAIRAIRAAGVDVLVIAPAGQTARTVREAAGPGNVRYVAVSSQKSAHVALAA